MFTRDFMYSVLASVIGGFIVELVMCWLSR